MKHIPSRLIPRPERAAQWSGRATAGLVAAVCVLVLFPVPGLMADEPAAPAMAPGWAWHFGIAPEDADKDPDGDGHTNLEESQLGTDPYDRESCFRLGCLPADAHASAAGTAPRLRWLGVKGRCYAVESSLTLDDWSDHGPARDGTGDPLEQSLDLAAPGDAGMFFRVRLLPDEDGDGDGLGKGEEALLGTDDGSTDSDGDGLADGDEIVTHSTDPASTDTDGGGLSDAFEIAAGSDPTRSDGDEAMSSPGPTGLEIFTPSPKGL